MDEDETEVPPYRKPTRDEIPYIIASRAVFKPEGRENERGLFIRKGMNCPYVRFVHREFWDAEPPKSTVKLTLPVSHVRFTDTGVGSRQCHDMEDCKLACRELQAKHMAEGHSDIHYNFLVGSEGTVLEGRGWSVEPHRPEKYASLTGTALDIAYIGDFSKETPSWEMEKNAYDFIKYGVDELIIERQYNITGYKQ